MGIEAACRGVILLGTTEVKSHRVVAYLAKISLNPYKGRWEGTHSAKAPLSSRVDPLMKTKRTSPFFTSEAGTSDPSSTTSPTASQPTMTPALALAAVCAGF